MATVLRTQQELELFRDREQAGEVLAGVLGPFILRPCVVAAIPRGGVAVALPIVERFGVPLTVAYARKLTAPIAPELAFGALDEDGEVLLDPKIVAMLELRPEDINGAKARVGAEIRRRMALYRVPPLADYLPDRSVVLVDDGLATGLTMRAALRYARRHGARDITVAAPCASGAAAAYFQGEADHFVTLVVDEMFVAVGTYYLDFSAVSDEVVQAMLERAGETTELSAEGRAARGQRPRSRAIKLPGPALIGERSIEDALRRRRSVREYGSEPLGCTQLAQLLWAAQGSTGPEGLRTAPSAGALYPLEVYVVVGRVEGVPAGVYRYSPGTRELLPVAGGDARAQLGAAALDQPSVREGAAVIVLAAVYGRTMAKYGERGRRYVHMEAGHAAQNVYLQAAALDLGTVVVGAFDDASVKRTVNMRTDEEPLYLLPVGRLSS